MLILFKYSYFTHNQKLLNKMEQSAITDQLTGCYTRRYFYTMLPREARRSFQSGEKLYLGMVDVDYFKYYNYIYGHVVGDLTLRKMAMAMQEVLRRAGNYCYRIGGEEFCFLFNAENIYKAKLVAEQLRSAVEEKAIPHQGNQPHGVLTISIGLIQIPPVPDLSLEQIMTNVDQALYMAKKRGRNQCVFLD